MADICATTSTIQNSPDFSTIRGEYTSVSLSSGKKQVKPNVKVTLTSLTVNNSGTLQKLNSVVIPIAYSNKFYKDMLDPLLDDVNKLIYYADIPVGAICCKFDNLAKGSKEPPTLVILTLAILAPYRSLSLGTSLLRSSMNAALHPTIPPPPIAASAHVQAGNEDAKRFYERLGFKQAGVQENYYSRMEPRGAIMMVCEDIATALGEKTEANGSA
nr:acetyltransferase [Cryptococcus depauperatus CBS 7855]